MFTWKNFRSYLTGGVVGGVMVSTLLIALGHKVQEALIFGAIGLWAVMLLYIFLEVVLVRVTEGRDEREEDPLVREIRRRNGCPDCGGVFLMGPAGGMSQNVMCENCLSKFNIMIIEGAGVVWAERI